MYVGGVCPRSEEVAGGAAQAPGATHPGAVRKVNIDSILCMYVCMYVCMDKIHYRRYVVLIPQMYVCMHSFYRDHAVVVGVYRPPPKKT